MHEFSLELYGNFVVKLKVFVQAIQTFVFYWHFADFDEFHSIIGRNRFKKAMSTYHKTNAVDRTRESSRKCISYMKYICNSRP